MFGPSYIRTRRQQLSAKALPAQIDREYGLKHDVDILHRQSLTAIYFPYVVHLVYATLVNQAEVVWLSTGKTLNIEENL